MKQVRDNYRSNPAKAIEAAREARQRFGDSRTSDERDSFLIQAYLNSHDVAAARAEMPYYYQHHPHGRWADYLFALTNVGPNSPP
jgi:outer membrane protein assembly factor BamD (BamD/ComL family)